MAGRYSMAEPENLPHLGRIREEVDAALMTARIALITSSEIAAIRKRLPICIEQLQQVHGALEMVQLPGAVMVLEEMLLLARELQTRELPQSAVDALIHALLQLPAYFEQLELGTADSPYITQPLIDELRAARGESPLAQESLFSPVLEFGDRNIEVTDDEAGQLNTLLQRLCPVYERALSEWRQQPAEKGYAEQLVLMMQALADASVTPVTRQLLEIAEAVLSLTDEGVLLPDNSLYRLLEKLGEELQQLLDGGENRLQDNPPEELMRHLLYCIARSRGGGECVESIRARYRLDQAFPPKERIARVHEDLKKAGRGPVQSAFSALRREIGTIKRELEMLLQEETRQEGDWQEVVNRLKQFATTLDFLELEISGESVRRQIEALQPIVDGKQKADKSRLMEVARTLLLVESVLREGVDETVLASDNAPDAALLVEGEHEKLCHEVCNEIISELNRLKAVLGNTPSGLQWKESLPALAAVSGALEMLELHQAVDLIQVCYRHIDSTINDTSSAQEVQPESVAELISSVEFCLETMTEGQSDVEKLLESAQPTAARLDESVTPRQQQPARTEDGENSQALASIIKASLASGGTETGLKTATAASSTKDISELEEEDRSSSTADSVSTVEREVADDAEAGCPDTPAVSDEPQSVPPEEHPVLLDIFIRETRNHLTAIRDFVDKADKAEQTGEHLLRTLHTLRGSALAAEVTDIATLAEHLENHVGKLAEKQLPVQGALLPLLKDSCYSIETVLEQLPQPDMEMVDKHALLERIKVLDKQLDSPSKPLVELTPEQKAEAELRQVFCDECDETLERYHLHLQQWQADSAETVPIQALERELHTLKGSARVAGMGAIADISHVLESLLAEVSAGQIKPSDSLFELFDEAYKQLLMMVEQIKRGGRPEDAPGLIRRIREFVAGARGITPQDEPEQEPLFSMVPDNSEGRIVHFPVPERESRATGEALTDNLARMPQLSPEQFRVRADLMDELADMASEAGICNSRIGQQMEEILRNISELRGTVDRVYEQLRQLDIETESQMFSRCTGMDESAAEQFDPLELDRFSRKQTLARGILESLDDLASLEELLTGQAKQSEVLLQQQGKATRGLQDALNRVRLQSFSNYLPRLHRVVEQACKELGKEVELYTEGAEQELDRSMLARVLPSIEHILRNAVVHGIEPPDLRRKAGKAGKGKITIQLERHGSDMLVRIADDGAGLDLDQIQSRGVEAGYLRPDTLLTEEQAIQFIQQAGFSTAESVTQLAGRGVGLDVVKNEIHQLGGTIQIRSRQGEGVQFALRLPLIRYLSSALLVGIGNETYALPPMGIEGITRIEGAQIIAGVKGGGAERYIHCMGQDYRIEILADLVGFLPSLRYRDDRHYIVVLLRVAEHRLAVVVDKVVGEREIMMKSFGPQLSRIKGIPGATFLDDGSAVMVLDLAALIEPDEIGFRRAIRRPMLHDHTSRRQVLVVDDSITVRRVMARFLERHGMRVLTAKDGMEAIPLLEKHCPDLVLLDIEMPQMNGYELARYIRSDSRIKQIPIIMITSRSGSKHRKKAKELGIDFYLNKPYQEDVLLNHIHQLLTPDRAREV